MSWQDNINQPFTITTGDGIMYTPLWDATKSVVLSQEFNIAEFNFRKLKGTLVDRGEVKGNTYDIEVIFQGADHLIHAANFRKSAQDKRVWTVNHPYYGIIVCQPARLKYNNEDGNITRIQGTILETIRGDSLSGGVDPFDKIAVDKLAVDNALFTTYVAEVPVPEIKDVQAMTANVGKLDTSVSPLVKLTDDYNAFRNAVNAANSFIATATTAPGAAMAAIQSVITAPANFIDSEVNRIAMLTGAFAGFYNYAVNLPRTLKKLYENNAGTAISTMCLASVTNIGADYTTRTAVVAIVQTILNNYSQYIDNLDALSTDNGGEPDSYIPDADSVNAISSLVNYTVEQLLIIAANAKQQQTYILPEDDNVTTLAYTLYGSAADDIVDQLIADNGIYYTELLLIRKGREIIYYT